MNSKIVKNNINNNHSAQPSDWRDNPDVIIKKENNPNDSSNGTTPDSTPIINE